MNLVLWALGLGFVIVYAWSAWRMLLVLSHEDHPDHELAKEAVRDQHERDQRERWKW